MCDYCDCRSHPELAELSDEHDRIHVLLDRLRSTADELRNALDAHTRREERGVFAQLRQEVDAAYLARFLVDHERVHELVDALTDHIAREETDLFPAAHQLLSPRQWEAMAAPQETVR